MNPGWTQIKLPLKDPNGNSTDGAFKKQNPPDSMEAVYREEKLFCCKNAGDEESLLWIMRVLSFWISLKEKSPLYL